ncbi:GFA family protein [Bdellovibrio bacteriovorus]|uniref:GFA family protein n=1 Tax=Bdellovibrio bacteriovorus TaxID=959 RepID=UPI0021D0E972|nr:GFA family protein [Bdellovibrio bacteriovorus]UXR65443.1 GFA family protein [Bdellovibrio bacteriovorus]
MQKHQGSCHCGKVKFEATGAFNEVISCNCSMCQRKGTLLAFVPETQFTLLSGADSLTDYQFGKKKIHHTFCSTCGVTSFATGETPDGTKMKAINVRCLEGIDLKALTVQECDGRSF